MSLDPFSPELHFALGNALVLPCLALTVLFGPVGLLSVAVLCRLHGLPFLKE